MFSASTSTTSNQIIAVAVVAVVNIVEVRGVWRGYQRSFRRLESGSSFFLCIGEDTRGCRELASCHVLVVLCAIVVVIVNVVVARGSVVTVGN